MLKTNVEFGRPKNIDAERQFKRHFAENSTRIELECQTLHLLYYEHFNGKDVSCVATDQLRQLFAYASSERFWTVLHNGDSKASWQQSNDNQRFTSAYDVRYMVHTIQREGVKSMTANDILLTLTAYLMKIHMMNVYLLQFIQKALSSGQFERIILQGPASATPKNYSVLQRMAHWGLCLLQLEGIKVLRRAEPQQPPTIDSSVSEIDEEIDP